MFQKQVKNKILIHCSTKLNHESRLFKLSINISKIITTVRTIKLVPPWLPEITQLQIERSKVYIIKILNRLVADRLKFSNEKNLISFKSNPIASKSKLKCWLKIILYVLILLYISLLCNLLNLIIKILSPPPYS